MITKNDFIERILFMIRKILMESLSKEDTLDGFMEKAEKLIGKIFK
jgi:hypothetical protein